MITLRVNQTEPIDKAIRFFRESNPDPSLIVLPTAWGKSILTAFAAKHSGEHLIVLQPSKEPLEQNFKKYITLWVDSAQMRAFIQPLWDEKRLCQSLTQP